MSLTKVSYSMITGAPVNVLDYGATGDGVTNDTVAIQAAITAVNAAGGGIVYIPVGTYIVGALTMKTKVRIVGDGPSSTFLKSSHTGDGLMMVSPVNASTAVYTSVENLQLWNTNANNVGAGYDDIGGTYVNLFNVIVYGFKYGIVLDQTELATIRQCQLGNQIAGGGGIWLVSGADHLVNVTFTSALMAGATSGTLTTNWTNPTGTYLVGFVNTSGGAIETRFVTLTNGSTAAAFVTALTNACNAATQAAPLGTFTNRITIQECQFNEGVAVYGIADDGGYVQSITNNNFNGCLTHIGYAGCLNISIQDNEFETAASTPITSNNTSLVLGVSVGASQNVYIANNAIIPSISNSCIIINAASNPLTLVNNLLGNSTPAKVTGLNLVGQFIELGNTNGGGGASYSGNPTIQFRSDDTGSFTPGITFGGAAVGVTGTFTGLYTRINNVVNISIQITLTSKGSSTGSIEITGLPYDSKTGFTQSIPVAFSTGIITATSVGALITSVSKVIKLQNANVNYTNTLTDANISNTTVFYISGQYIAG